MREIEALETLNIGAGTILRLSDKQARARASVLVAPANGNTETLETVLQKSKDKKSPRDGVYQATVPVQFKRGEVFGMEGEIPKAARAIVNVDGVKADNAVSQPSPAMNVRAAPAAEPVPDSVFDNGNKNRPGRTGGVR